MSIVSLTLYRCYDECLWSSSRSKIFIRARLGLDEGVRRINQMVQGDLDLKEKPRHGGDPSSDPASESGPIGSLSKLFPWLAGGIFILVLLYRSNSFALLWLPHYQEIE